MTESISGRTFVVWYIKDIYTGDYVKDVKFGTKMFFDERAAVKCANAIAQQMLDEAEGIILGTSE